MQLNDEVDYLLQHIASTMHRQSDQVLQERLGLGLSQLRILKMLMEQSNKTQKDIAEGLGQTEAGVSRQIKILVEKGFLAVRVNPSNRREHVIAPTPRAVKITEAAAGVISDYQSPVYAVHNEKQLKQLRDLLADMHLVACAASRPHVCDKGQEA